MKRATPNSPAKNPKPAKSRNKPSGSSSRATAAPPKERTARQLETPDASMVNRDDDDWEDEDVEMSDSDSAKKRGRPPKGEGKGKSAASSAAKFKAAVLKIGAFKDLAKLTEAFLNKLCQALKLIIVSGRTKEAARTAKAEEFKSRSQYLHDLAEYKGGLTEMGRMVFEKQQLEDAISRRLGEERKIKLVEKENIELRYKLMEFEQASEKLSRDLNAAQTDAAQKEKERLLEETGRLLASTVLGL